MSDQLVDLRDKIVFVTGAAQGQGAEHARTTARLGARVVLAAKFAAESEAHPLQPVGLEPAVVVSNDWLTATVAGVDTGGGDTGGGGTTGGGAAGGGGVTGGEAVTGGGETGGGTVGGDGATGGAGGSVTWKLSSCTGPA